MEDLQAKLDKKSELVRERNKTLKVVKAKSKELNKLKQELLAIKKASSQPEVKEVPETAALQS